MCRIHPALKGDVERLLIGLVPSLHFTLERQSVMFLSRIEPDRVERQAVCVQSEQVSISVQSRLRICFQVDSELVERQFPDGERV